MMTAAQVMTTKVVFLLVMAGLLLPSKQTPSDHPRGYVAYRASSPLTIDGRLDDGPWRDAPWTETFVDIEGTPKPRPRFDTRVKMLWNDAYFYIGADMNEPNLWATLTTHDSVIFLSHHLYRR